MIQVTVRLLVIGTLGTTLVSCATTQKKEVTQSYTAAEKSVTTSEAHSSNSEVPPVTSTIEAQKTKSLLQDSSGVAYFYTKNLFNLSSEELQPFRVSNIQLKDWQVTHLIVGHLIREGEELRFNLSRTFALKAGTLYGWAMRFNRIKRSSEKVIEITEALNLPETPQRLVYDTSSTKVDQTGRVVTSQWKTHPDEIWVYHFWEVTEDDPKGSYRLNVFSGKQKISEILFTLL